MIFRIFQDFFQAFFLREVHDEILREVPEITLQSDSGIKFWMTSKMSSSRKAYSNPEIQQEFSETFIKQKKPLRYT